MIKTKNETLGAVPRNFWLLGFAFLVLALSFGSVAANATPQVLKGSEGMTRCRINNINLKTGLVIASVIDGGTTTVKESSGGQSFRFFVKDPALLNSLKVGDAIFADFNTKEVFTSTAANGQGVRLGGILTNNFGKPSAGTVGGTNQQPIKAGELGPADGAKLGNAANPGQPNCQITGINAATGVVSAKDLSTGQAFQFTVRDSALFSSFKMGQRFFVNFNSRQASLDGKTFTGIQSVGGSLPN